jgi:sporulation protein YlmC with PRC-barrel domain
MRFSDATGRQIVSTSTAETVGQVDEFVVDPRSRAVVAITVKKSHGGDTLPWANITAFGVDAVTVPGADGLLAPGRGLSALIGKDHRLPGKRVLSTAGDELGKVTDVDFDPATGAITTLILSTGEVAGLRFIGVGSYAVVVHAA